MTTTKLIISTPPLPSPTSPPFSPPHSPTELPPTALWKNLWRTNNLEQYRGRAASNGNSESGGVEESKGEDLVEGMTTKADLASHSYPKVLITVRSELLSSDPNYRSHFLPLESQNQDKDQDLKDFLKLKEN